MSRDGFDLISEVEPPFQIFIDHLEIFSCYMSVHVFMSFAFLGGGEGEQKLINH